MQLRSALSVLRRRLWLALLIFLLPSAAIAGATRVLPSIYESTAILLVEHQQVADRLVGPMDADVLETRLRSISQQILSRSRLEQLITQFNLYPEIRGRFADELIVERMRKDLRLEFKGARDAIGRDSTIAINLSYRGRDPELVATVTNALATLFVGENARVREQQAAGATAFLKSQMDEAQRQLAEKERRITAFKDSHLGELPEQQASNLAALERINAQLRVLNDRELRILERRDALMRQRSGAPDATVPVESPAMRLVRLRADLARLRTQYTDEHPDIARIKEEIAALERLLAAPANRPSSLESPQDPQTAIAQADKELTALRSEEAALRRTIALYEQRVETAPRREGELQQLTGDYAATKERYASLLKRYEDAQLTERMQGLSVEQFRILDPAVRGRMPVAPHRVRLLLMGLALSAGAAAGIVLLAELYSGSFHTVDDLRAFTRIPILVSIPPIVTAADTRRNRLRSIFAILGTAVTTVAIGIVSAYVARGNDVLATLLPGKH